jgi:tetratricopeptide (TPR) repeat protein
MFYCRMAQDWAEKGELTHLLVEIYALRGNLLLAQSEFEEALQWYSRAWDDRSGDTNRMLATPPLFCNIGYCHVMLGRLHEGRVYLLSALRALIHLRVSKGMLLATIHTDLCYLYLETERYSLAKRHGKAALEIAESESNHGGIKTALYLLGEAEHLSGNEMNARTYLERLQEHYPNVPVISLLMTTQHSRLPLVSVVSA